MNLLEKFQLVCAVYVLLLKKFGKPDATNLMNALVVKSFGPPDILEIEKVPKPQISAKQALIRVKAVAVMCLDELASNDTEPNKESGSLIPGREIAGVVEEISGDAGKLNKGNQVFCYVKNGGYAEYAAANLSSCYPLPNKLSFSQGAVLYDSYLSAYRALKIRGNVTKDEIVLIHGAEGNFGIAAIQVAKALGAHVVATVADLALRDLMKNAGADYIVYQNIRHYLEKMTNKIKKSGFNVILEIPTSTNPNPRQRKNHLAEKGRVVVFGKHSSITVSDEQLKESKGRVISFSQNEYSLEEQNKAANFVIDDIERGTSVKPIVTSEYKLEESVKAQTDVSIGKSSKGKLVYVL